AGLYFSYSQSSLAALFVAVLSVTFVAGDHRARRMIAVAAATFVLVGTGLVAADVKGQSLRHLTSGRSHLVSVTLDVFRSHPLVGVGVGSQPLASAEEQKSGGTAKRNASHTTPLTVAAELGIAGLAAYLARPTTTRRARWPFASTTRMWRPASRACRTRRPGRAVPLLPRNRQSTTRASASTRTPKRVPTRARIVSRASATKRIRTSTA